MEQAAKDVAKTDLYGLPNGLASPEEKATEAFGLQYARAIWSRQQIYLNTFSEIKARYILNRKYAEGLQSIEKYRNSFDVNDTSWLNLDFTALSIIPKFVNNICGVLAGNKYKIDTEVLNSASKTSQDDFRNKLYANKLLKPLHDQIAPKTGLSMVPQGSVVPEDDEELEIYIQQNYKPDEAMAMQLALKYVFDSNDFPYIEEKCIRDLVVLKIAAIKRYYDAQMNICLENIDPVDLVFPYSKYDDFRNIPYVAINKKYTIAEIAQQTDKFSEEDLWEIAKQYQGNNYGNRPWGYGLSYAGYYPAAGLLAGRPYDDFNINVLEFEFLATDPVTFEKKTNKTQGNSYFNKKKSDYQPKEDKKYSKEITTKTIKNRYEGSWIVGSHYIYNYKKANNVPRDKVNGVYSTDATLQIKIVAPEIYDMTNRSIVDSIIPFADQLMLISLKIQQILMKMMPAGYAVDMDSVQNVMAGLGGQAMKAADVIKLFTQTGSMVFRRTREDGREINGDPIKFNPGGLPAGFDLLLQAYNQNMQNMYAAIGYNPAVAGDAKNDQLVGAGEQQIAAANNSLAPLKSSYRRLVERLAKEVALQIQDKIEYGGGLDGFERAIGKESIEVIRAAKGLPLCEFGIKVEYMPDAQQQASLTNKINIALQEQSIDLADSIQVEQQARTDIKLAIQLLVYLKGKRQKIKMQEAAQNSQLNSQQQVASSQAKAQADQQSLSLEMQGKMKLMQLEYQLKAQNADKEHKNKMQELLLTYDKNTDVTKLEHDLQLLQTSFENSIQGTQQSASA